MVVKLEFRSRLSRARLRVVLSHMVVKHNRNAAEKLEGLRVVLSHMVVKQVLRYSLF